MSTRCLYFIRHGQSTSNAGGLSRPPLEVPLSETGHRQAEALADIVKLTPSGAVTSQLKRAQQTAAYFCERHGLTPSVEPLTDEFATVDFELIKGMYGEQRRPFVEKYWAAADPACRLGAEAETFP